MKVFLCALIACSAPVLGALNCVAVFGCDDIAANNTVLNSSSHAYGQYNGTYWEINVDDASAMLTNSQEVANERQFLGSFLTLSLPTDIQYSGTAIKWGPGDPFFSPADETNNMAWLAPVFRSSWAISLWVRHVTTAGANSNGRFFGYINGTTERLTLFHYPTGELQVTFTADEVTVDAKTVAAIFPQPAEGNTLFDWTSLVVIANKEQEGPYGISIYVNGERQVLDASADGDTTDFSDEWGQWGSLAEVGGEASNASLMFASYGSASAGVIYNGLNRPVMVDVITVWSVLSTLGQEPDDVYDSAMTDQDELDRGEQFAKWIYNEGSGREDYEDTSDLPDFGEFGGEEEEGGSRPGIEGRIHFRYNTDVEVRAI